QRGQQNNKQQSIECFSYLHETISSECFLYWFVLGSMHGLDVLLMFPVFIAARPQWTSGKATGAGGRKALRGTHRAEL
ncbi:MAG: hypothetical protein D6790_19680, partial [Caldilineae bacterium]